MVESEHPGSIMMTEEHSQTLHMSFQELHGKLPASPDIDQACNETLLHEVLYVAKWEVCFCIVVIPRLMICRHAGLALGADLET